MSSSIFPDELGVTSSDGRSGVEQERVRRRRAPRVGLGVAAMVMVGPCMLSPSVVAAPDESIETVAIGRYPSLVLDAVGNPVIAYTDTSTAENADLRLVHCSDPNCAGDDESRTIVDAEGNTGWYPSLVLDAAGNPVISYYDGTNNVFRLAHCNDPDCAGDDESLTTIDAAERFGLIEGPQGLALDATGNPVLAYLGEERELRLAHCNDPDCSGGDESLTTVDAGDTGWDPSLVLDSAGNPVIAYTDFSSRELLLAHCNDPDCAGDDDPVNAAVDTPGIYKSLVLDAAGNPVISFSAADQTLGLAHCNDPNCAGDDTTTSTVDAVDLGSTTSLALDAAGNPVISYYLETNREVRLAHCNDPDCLDDDAISTIAVTDWNTFSSLALDAAGNPVISYTDGPDDGLLNDELRLAHCNDPNCAGTDDTAPVISVPDSHVIIAAPPGASGAIVNFDISATDDHDGVVPVTCDPASGAEFPLGTTVVSCTATDAAGNTATVTISVTVQPSPTDTLPATGADTTTSLSVAGLLVALGSALSILVRHRQRHLP